MNNVILNRLKGLLQTLAESLLLRLTGLNLIRIPARVPVVTLQATVPSRRRWRHTYSIGLSALAALLLAGCQSPPQVHYSDFAPPTAPAAESLTLREGDTVRITFPGSPNLNTVQQIRRDGKISLPLVGEFKAVGMTPSDLEKELVKLYAPQLVTKEVNVALDSSAFFVFVTGAVARPGKIMFDRPITALEAVIDAGVDYAKANLKDVTVIRRKAGNENQFHLNLKDELRGHGSEPFYLQPSDIVFVRERFTWF